MRFVLKRMLAQESRKAKQSKPYVLGRVPVVCQYAQATWPCVQPSMPFRPASFNLPAAFQHFGDSKGLRAALHLSHANSFHSDKLHSYTDQELTNARFE